MGAIIPQGLSPPGRTIGNVLTGQTTSTACAMCAGSPYTRDMFDALKRLFTSSAPTTVVSDDLWRAAERHLPFLDALDAIGHRRCHLLDTRGHAAHIFGHCVHALRNALDTQLDVSRQRFDLALRGVGDRRHSLRRLRETARHYREADQQALQGTGVVGIGDRAEYQSRRRWIVGWQ